MKITIYLFLSKKKIKNSSSLKKKKKIGKFFNISIFIYSILYNKILSIKKRN